MERTERENRRSVVHCCNIIVIYLHYSTLSAVHYLVLFGLLLYCVHFDLRCYVEVVECAALVNADADALVAVLTRAFARYVDISITGK